MVYKITWTLKAIESYADNMAYLEKEWTKKEIAGFANIVEKKLQLLAHHLDIGTSRSKKHPNIKHTVLHKRISLIYRMNTSDKIIELLRFWNNYQNPAKLKP